MFNRIVLASLALIFVPACLAEEADYVREKGIAVLKESQTNPRAIVEAARLFIKAAELYNAAGNEEKNVEMNSFLYWCKKKMTMEDIDVFTKGGEGTASTKLDAIEKLVPTVEEAQKYLDRAEKFATKNPAEHLLIAIRFYEVADRFKGSDAGMKALDRSLKEQLQDKSSGPAKNPLPPENAPATVDSKPVPSADEIKKSEKLIKDILKEDYAKTDVPGRLALVAKLLQQADENKGDAVSEYVLLHEARDIAVLGGDSALATGAQKRLRDAFNIDFAAMLIDLRRLDANTKVPSVATALATLLAFISDDALVAENFDQALRYNSRAEGLVALIKDAPLKELMTRLKAGKLRILAFKQASDVVINARNKLKGNPDDPAANLIVGKFALQKGEFEEAFKMLAKGNDSVLVDIAKRELTPSADAIEQATLADNWFDRAEKELNSYIKIRMQERALNWYSKAMPTMTGLVKLKIEARIKTLQALSKPDNSIDKGTVIDLLSLIDPQKDNERDYGNEVFYRDNNAIVLKSGLIRFPYHPAKEYDIKFVYTPQKSTAVVVVNLVTGNCTFDWAVGHDTQRMGLEDISGKAIGSPDNPTSRNLVEPKADNSYEIIFQVRNEGVKVSANGILACEWKDYQQLVRSSYWKMSDNLALGVGCVGGQISIQSFKLIECTGKGQFTRPENLASQKPVKLDIAIAVVANALTRVSEELDVALSDPKDYKKESLDRDILKRNRLGDLITWSGNGDKLMEVKRAILALRDEFVRSNTPASSNRSKEFYQFIDMHGYKEMEIARLNFTRSFKHYELAFQNIRDKIDVWERTLETAGLHDPRTAAEKSHDRAVK